MKKIVAVMLSIVFMTASAYVAFADNKAVIKVHGEKDVIINDYVTVDNTTLVPLRSISEALGLGVMWFPGTNTILLWNDEFEFRAVVNSDEAKINGEAYILTKPIIAINSVTYIPLRNLAEALGAVVKWNSEDGSIDIIRETKKLDNYKNNIVLSDDKKVFYSQPQEEWGFENNGRGYCWVCSYAMILTETLKEVITPDMIADVNKEKGSGAYMQHELIRERFNIAFTPAIPTDSENFIKYDAGKGATYVKADTDDEAVKVLKEALDKNPNGVMVRYTVYPHTMYAVGYSGDVIYFNEPAYENGEYMTFDETCLKNYKLCDFDFIQAIKKK